MKDIYDRDLKDLLKDTQTARRVLVELYPTAAHNVSRCAGVILRRLQLRERDLLGFLDTEVDKEGN